MARTLHQRDTLKRYTGVKTMAASNYGTATLSLHFISLSGAVPAEKRGYLPEESQQQESGAILLAGSGEREQSVLATGQGHETSE